MAIGMVAFSLAIGFLSFYLFSDLTKEEKKKHMEVLISQFINFLLFIWLGKIVLNLSIFLTDPFSILAYPSDSKAFYFAIVLMAIFLFYQSRRKNMNVLPLMESFVHIFLISSFVYEFIQIVVEDNPYAFGYFILLAILIGGFFFLKERVPGTMLLIIQVTAWSIGMMSLAFVQPYVTVFGYMMALWFIGLIFIASIGSLTYQLRKRDA